MSNHQSMSKQPTISHLGNDNYKPSRTRNTPLLPLSWQPTPVLGIHAQSSQSYNKYLKFMIVL